LLAVIEPMLFYLFTTVPTDLPVNYYALYVIQKVHFIITLVSL